MENDIQKTRTYQILTVMRILAWVAFVGFSIETGAVLISYVVSSINPEAAKNLYKGLNLYNLRQFNFWNYTASVSFLVSISAMKSYISCLVIGVLSKLSLTNPFTTEVANRLEKISYYSLGTWAVTILSNAHTAWLMKTTGELHGNMLSGEFIFMTAIVFILSQIFKRGVEIQSENELTV